MDLRQPANPGAGTFREAERPQRYRGRRRNLRSKSKSGQAPGKTPARLEVGAGEWLNGHHAPAECQVPAGTMAEKVTGRSSHPSMNWLTWMYTFLPAGGAPNRAVYRLVMSAEPCTAAGHMPTMAAGNGTAGHPIQKATGGIQLPGGKEGFLRGRRLGRVRHAFLSTRQL